MDGLLNKSIDPAKLRDAREKAGLTQEEVGDRCGVTYQQISHIECGNKQPSSTLLIRLCALYGLELSDITTEAESV